MNIHILEIIDVHGSKSFALADFHEHKHLLNQCSYEPKYFDMLET